MFKTNDLQNIIYTSMADDINVTIKNLYLFVPNFLPSVETQLMFNEATQKNHKIAYDEYSTGRQIISEMIFQVDIGSAQQVNSPKNLIFAHQMKDRIDPPNKNKNNGIFDHLNLKKYSVEIVSQ